jgi:hypothetical protein
VHKVCGQVGSGHGPSCGQSRTKSDPKFQISEVNIYSHNLNFIITSVARLPPLAPEIAP